MADSDLELRELGKGLVLLAFGFFSFFTQNKGEGAGLLGPSSRSAADLYIEHINTVTIAPSINISNNDYNKNNNNN